MIRRDFRLFLFFFSLRVLLLVFGYKRWHCYMRVGGQIESVSAAIRLRTIGASAERQVARSRHRYFHPPKGESGEKSLCCHLARHRRGATGSANPQSQADFGPEAIARAERGEAASSLAEIAEQAVGADLAPNEGSLEALVVGAGAEAKAVVQEDEASSSGVPEPAAIEGRSEVGD